MQLDRRMFAQKRLHSLSLVRRQVVGDHVNLLTSRLMRHDVGEKRYELLRGVPRRGLAYHFAGLRIERRVQRQRAVPVVLQPMPFGSSRRQRQHRIVAIERLNRRLLVHAEHRRVRRRVQVQPDDVGSLLLEVRIVGAHVALQPVRLQPMLVPHPRHHHVRHPQLGRQAASAPVRAAIGRRLAGRVEDLCLHLRRAPKRLLTAVPAVQSGQSLATKAASPQRHEAAAALGSFAHVIPGESFCEQQNDARTARIFSSTGATSDPVSELAKLGLAQHDPFPHTSDYSTKSDGTVR